MRKLLILAGLFLWALAAHGQTVLHSPPLWCEVGGEKVRTSGLSSTNEVQRSIPACTVTVYNAGSVNVASIFSDSLATPTPKANPFSAASNGLISFYAAASCYDIVTSGGTGSDTFPFPITYFGVCFGGSGGGGSGGGSVTSVGFSAPAGFTVTGTPVTGVGTLALSMPAGWTTQDLLVGDGANSVTRLPKGADQTCLTLVAGLVGWGAGPCVGIPAGTTNQIVKRTDGPNSVLGDSSLFDDGSNPVQAPNGLSVMSSGLPRVIVNANPATTVLNQLVERNASGFAINASVSSLRALGVAGQNAGINSAALQVTSVGYGTCVFDGTTVINDYAIPSSTTAGLCHDAGATRPLNAEVMGTVTTVNAGAGTTAMVDFFTGDTSQTTPSAIAPCGTSPGPMAYYTAASTLGCDILMLTDGSGNGTMASLTLGGASAGYLFFTASSQPSFPVANSAYMFAPTSIPTTYALKLPSALGTSGQALSITGVASNVATLGWTSAAGCAEGTCLQNAPATDQTLTGAHSLINNGGSFRATNTAATPSTSAFNFLVNGSGRGSIAFAGSGSSNIFFDVDGGLVFNPAIGSAQGVTYNNAGVYYAGSSASFPSGVSCAFAPHGICSAVYQQPIFLAGNTSGGTVLYAQDIALNNIVSLPNSTGTLANIVGGVLTTPHLTLSAITGSVQCLHVDTAGVVSGAAGDCATGGSGTVTSVATSAPLGGGTITTTGTLTCTTCVVATSPGLGLAHFAGSTQTVTSSLVVNADVVSIDAATKLTGITPSANGGTANAFFTVSGPASSAKTFTFPNSSATVLTSAAAVTVPQGGTGLTSGTSGGIPAYTSSTVITSSGVLTANALVKGGGAGAVPTVSVLTESAGVFATNTDLVSIAPSATSANGALNVAPSATGTPASIFNCASGITVDCFDVQINGVNQFSIDLNGKTNLQPSSTTSASFNISTASAALPSSPVAGDVALVGNQMTYYDSAATQQNVAASGVSTTFTQQQNFVSPNASTTAVTVKAAATPSVDVFDWLDSTGTVQAAIDKNFNLIVPVVKTNGSGAGQEGFGAGTNQGVITNQVSESGPATLTGTGYDVALPGVEPTAGQVRAIGTCTSHLCTSTYVTPNAGTVTSVGFTGGLISVATATTTPAFTVAGTSGGIPYFSAASTWASSAALTANLPVIGGGAGAAPSVGSRTGNTTQFASWTGATTAARCVDTDASGNLQITAADCGSGGGSPTFPVNAQTTTYQVLAADFSACKTITVASGTFTVTLVASGSQPTNGQCVDIINYGSGVVTVARSGQNINGAAVNQSLAAGSASAPTGLHVVSDGTNYFAQAFVAAGAGGGTVTSVTFTGDGTVLSSTPSSAVTTSGTVTAALANAAAYTALQNTTGSSAAPTYASLVQPYAQTSQSGTAATTSFTQNVTKMFGFLLKYYVTTTTVGYSVSTADNTGNLYDVGLYGPCTGGQASCPLVAHLGATAGTSFASSAADKSATWTGGSVTLVPGRYYVAFTTNCSASCAVLRGVTDWTFANGTQATVNNTTSGGALNSTVTSPADAWVAFNSGTIPSWVIR